MAQIWPVSLASLVGLPALVLRIAGGSDRAVDVPALAELGEVRGCAVLINSGDDARLPARGARFTAVPPRVADFGTFPVRAFATWTGAGSKAS